MEDNDAMEDINRRPGTEAIREIYVHEWQSPVGHMILGSYGEKVCLCDWAVEKRRDMIDRRICRVLKAEYATGCTPIIEEMIAELQQYFAGERREFGLPIHFAGTEFQCRVWTELMSIPYATTLSYGELARRIGHPRAVRAVATAVATNPVSIFVPCHRVIGSDGTLTGYAGGLAAKQALLSLERAITPPLL